MMSRRSILTGFLILFVLCVGLLADDNGMVRGRVWIRVRDNVDLSQRALSDLGLPGNPRIRHALLKPSQCIASGYSSMIFRTQIRPSSTERSDVLRALESMLCATYVIEFDSNVSPEAFCSAALGRKSIVAETYPVYANVLQYKPNDPLVNQQEYLGILRAMEAWDISRGDSTVVVAISDAGIRTSHEDLKTKIAVNSKEIPYNGIDDDNNGFIDDYAGYNFFHVEDKSPRDEVFNPNEGHGTHVAGIIGAAHDNAKGIAGLAGKCSILPIKISSNADPGTLYFAYESILYAALSGAAVVNCSWGNDRQGFNPLEQAIIDYATARGTSVVVAAGNYNARRTDTFYPAAYNNVLSVMETDNAGVVTESSSYGAHCSVMAPGTNALTTANSTNSSYTNELGISFSGTSAAAPMASGALALVRAKYPTLSARAAIEHLRVTGRSFANANPTIRDFTCNVPDAQAALLVQPYAVPSVRVTRTTLRNQSGRSISRCSIGDTVLFFFDLKNYLGKVSSLRSSMRVVDPNGTNSVFVLDSTATTSAIDRDSSAQIGPFKAVITQNNTQRLFLRLDFSGLNENNVTYSDFQLVEFTPTSDFITLSNNSISFSLGDYGWIGSNQFTTGQRKGAGFSYGEAGNLLYRGGLFCTDLTTVRSGIGTDGSTDHDFFVRSRSTPWPYVLTMSDQESQDAFKLGVTLQQTWNIIDPSLALCDVVFTNDSPDSWPAFALGMFLDWDITAMGDSCRVRRFKEAEPQDVNGMAEIMWRTDKQPVVACLALSESSEAQGQAAGLGFDFMRDSGGFLADENKIRTLISRDSIQAAGIDDMSMVVGMRFPSIPSGASRKVRFVLGAAPSADSLARMMKATATTTSVSHTTTTDADALCSPNPASDFTRIHVNDGVIRSVYVRDMAGRVLWTSSHAESEATASSTMFIPLSSYASGMYVVEVHDDRGRTRFSRLAVVR